MNVDKLSWVSSLYFALELDMDLLYLVIIANLD